MVNQWDKKSGLIYGPSGEPQFGRLQLMVIAASHSWGGCKKTYSIFRLILLIGRCLRRFWGAMLSTINTKTPPLM